MGYSASSSEGFSVPAWAAYAVLFCHSHTLAGRPDRDVVHYFTARRDAERFARAASLHFPARTGDDLTIWALVYALPSTGRDRIATAGVCYLAYDPGGVVLKRHAYEHGYGVRAAPTLAGAAY